MTIGQLPIFNALYLILLAAVVIITRAGMRRIVGALVGALGAAAAGIAVIAPPGIAPMLAISVAYVVLVVVGHGLMRVISGPATVDPLARRSKAGING